MGCDGLQKILLSAVEYHDLLQYFVVQSFETSGNGGECQPKVVAFDASIWMYQADRAIKHGNADAGPNPQLRILFYRAARLLSLPICVVFVFDGPARPAIKRGTKVLTHGHWLTGSFQKLIEAFGYHWYMAPGEAEAEMAQLSAMGVIDIVVTTDTDALIFGAKNLMILYPEQEERQRSDGTLHIREYFHNAGCRSDSWGAFCSLPFSLVGIIMRVLQDVESYWLMQLPGEL
ncbi:PIN domain-like protein [Mycena olivaceomarginata]|nr:PIN domain-like protein [Mycena olivaceomarginata]